MTDNEFKGDGPKTSPSYAGYQQKPDVTRAADTGGADTPTGTAPPKPQVDLRQKAKEDMAAMRSTAKDEISGVYHSAEDAAERQKGYAADRVAGIASAMQKAGSELESQEQPEIGRMTRQLGDSVGRFADDLQGKSLSEIAAMAEDFGRRQPLAFLGIAAIAGLAASRFVGASASRQSPMASRQAGARQPASSMGGGGRDPSATGTRPITPAPATAPTTSPKTAAPTAGGSHG
jgi:hypothetical protein